MLYPPKPKPGDRVAVISPSAGLPGLFPHVFEFGLKRLTEELGLVPVEYPTTREMGSSPADRARDIHAAFSDPDITAVMASIGGEDQITVLPHLDPELLRANPKPFFGYSDNTNLLNYLYNLGIVGFHGGSVMVHLARGGQLHRSTLDSLRAALFTSDWYALTPSTEFGDEAGDWGDPATRLTEPPTRTGPSWEWHNADDKQITGRLWGGNLEIMSWLLAVNRWMQPSDAYAGRVLVLETSEEMPPPVEVFRMLRNMGERGLLEMFPAVLVARPQAWSHSHLTTLDQRERFADAQREAVLRAVSAYRPDALVVFNLDIGHTDPQEIVPIGGEVRIDGVQRSIEVRY